MAASLLHQQAGLASAPQGVGRLLIRFLEYFSALPETPDALHAVMLDSASRLRPTQMRRKQLLRAGAPLANSMGGGGSGEGLAGDAAAASLAQDDAAAYEEAVFASSLLVQDPLSPKFSNVSGTAFRWALVQRTFRGALQRLQVALSGGSGEQAKLLEALFDEQI